MNMCDTSWKTGSVEEHFLILLFADYIYPIENNKNELAVLGQLTKMSREYGTKY